MKLKALFITLLFLGTSYTIFAQEYKENIKTDFSAYLGLIVNKEYEKSMNYILPEFFEIFPKSQIVKLMEQIFNDPSLELTLSDPKILSIGDLEEIEGKFYVSLSYSNKMRMKIHGEKNEEEDAKTMRFSLTKASLNQTFGDENVTFNETTEFFEIIAQKEAYAISNNGLTDWKFLVAEKNQQFILEKLLPKALFEKP